MLQVLLRLLTDLDVLKALKGLPRTRLATHAKALRSPRAELKAAMWQLVPQLLERMLPM